MEGSKISREKRKVIMSYGIILCSFTPEHNPRFLLYQRRDSFAYMDYMRGYWSGKDDIYRLFELMSFEERDRIENYTFDELWDDLWVNHSYNIYKDGYKSAKRKYEYSRPYIVHALKTTQTVIRAPPWGFPKGKKNNSKEGDLACAIREFKEETKLDVSLKVKKDLTIDEKFKGTNGKTYSTKYFIAFTDKLDLPPKVSTPGCIREETVSEEANDVKWASYEEAIALLNPLRQNILDKVKHVITSKTQ
jgi:8-oxo-dGTP pyrophosphatase MutT (NUDIX family)